MYIYVTYIYIYAGTPYNLCIIVHTCIHADIHVSYKSSCMLQATRFRIFNLALSEGAFSTQGAAARCERSGSVLGFPLGFYSI